jgi:hypothetical protein
VPQNLESSLRRDIILCDHHLTPARGTML